MYRQLIKKITSNTVVITPTYRLSKQLKRIFYQQKLLNTDHVMPSAAIFALTTWIKHLWQQIQTTVSAPSYLNTLNHLQSQLIWEAIVNESEEGQTLLCARETARLAEQAWIILKQWNIDPTELNNVSHYDTQVWLRFARRFSERIQQANMIDEASLAQAIYPLIMQVAHILPDRIILVGFDDIVPQMRCLFDHIKNLKVDVIYFEPAVTSAKIARIRAQDLADEWYQSAVWAKSQLERNPNQSIGIIVPQLSQQFVQIERTFTDVLAPQTIFVNNAEQPKPFNISGGQALVQCPVIACAFALFALREQAIPYTQLSDIIRSPFLSGSQQEKISRVHLDLALRQLGIASCTLNELLNLLQYKANQENTNCPILYSVLKSLAEHIQHQPKQQTPTAWAEDLTTCLRHMGWPGQQSVSSHEHQAIMQWHGLLDEYCSLDDIVTSQSFSQALSCLQQAAIQHLFQVQSEDKSIQVVGMLEAGGLIFDKAWVTGLTADEWPNSPNPNPFLPIDFQRKHQMPHASSERELAFARVVTERFKGAAPEVILSYPSIVDAAECAVSPLIADVTEINLSTEPMSLALVMHQQQPDEFETKLDKQGPGIITSKISRGGAGLFKHQAACPFRAFAKYRLAAEPMGQTSAGFDALSRGEIIHKSLEKLWQRLKTQQTLTELSADELNQLIHTIVSQVLQVWQQQMSQPIGQQNYKLEHERITELLHDWVMIEKARPPFTVVACETNQIATIGPLSVHLRMDRIDQLEDGSYVVIDYKTGIPNMTEWLGERPLEPQLPLYCVIDYPRIQGLVYAQVRMNSCRFKGITAYPQLIPQVIAANELRGMPDSLSWDDLYQQWQRTLTQLADQFYQGYAARDPKEGTKTCQQCDLQMLCRMHEF